MKSMTEIIKAVIKAKGETTSYYFEYFLLRNPMILSSVWLGKYTINYNDLI